MKPGAIEQCLGAVATLQKRIQTPRSAPEDARFQQDPVAAFIRDMEEALCFRAVGIGQEQDFDGEGLPGCQGIGRENQPVAPAIEPQRRSSAEGARNLGLPSTRGFSPPIEVPLSSNHRIDDGVAALVCSARSLGRRADQDRYRKEQAKSARMRPCGRPRP